MDRESITLAAFHTRCHAQGAPTRQDLAVVCPLCGTVQSMRSLMAANPGLPQEEAERLVGFSCVGRLTNAGPPPHPKRDGYTGGCNWTLGGLLQLHELEIVTPDGVKHPHFALATPEQCQTLAAQIPAAA